MQNRLPVAFIVEHWQDLLSCNGNEQDVLVPVFADEFVDAKLDKFFHEHGRDPSWDIAATVVWICEEDTLSTFERGRRLTHRLMRWTDPDRFWDEEAIQCDLADPIPGEALVVNPHPVEF